MRGTVPMRAVRRLVEHLARTKTMSWHRTLAPPKMSGLAFKKPNKIRARKSGPQKSERFPGSAMRPLGRECEARGCTNLIAPTARVDARYCSDACRVEAHRSRNRYKNDSQLPDTDPPGNVRASVQETQQNWGSKSDPQETERFPACIWRGSHQGPQPERLHF